MPYPSHKHELDSLRYVAESAAEQLRVAEEREHWTQYKGVASEGIVSEKELLEKALATSTEAMSRAWLRITDLERELTSYQIAKDNLELRLSDADGGNEPLPVQVY